MYNKITSDQRFVLPTLDLAFISTGIISTIPSTSLLQLASNTNVTLAIALPMALTQRQQRATLQLSLEQHTIDLAAELPVAP
jgi:hypothetical protein